MAPVTRRSQQNNGAKLVKKAPARKSRAGSNTGREKESVDNLSFGLPTNGHNNEERSTQNGDDREEVMQLARVEVEDALSPLREMAEKVGREVETFAEDLDKFLDQLPRRNKFEAVLDLVDNFKAVAQDAAAALEESHRKEKAQQLREEWRNETGLSPISNHFSSTGDTRKQPMTDLKAAQVKELRDWQQEADIWDLLRTVLEMHHNPDKQATQQEKERSLAELGRPHRYTSEEQLYSRFLIENDLARERAKIKTWLEQAVDHQHSDLPNIVEELETKAGRGRGLWSHGWMHTREKIKHEKRLRPWPNSVNDPTPNIKRTDNNEQLVARLDPDSVSRQGRVLEKPDEFFERAMWIACWEMLRRGRSWEEISEWCEQRKEGWRAVAIGKAADSSKVHSNASWRKMCLLASRTGCTSDYEAAVYGLLGGNVAAMQRVCHTVDEQLYAYYSAALTRQFDQYLSNNFPERTPYQRRIAIDDDLQNPQEAIFGLITKLRSQSETGAESGRPMKLVQSYLLANEPDSLIHTLGHALSNADKLAGKAGDKGMIIHLGQMNDLPESEAAIDPHVLRIAAHISIILNVLSSKMLEGDERDAEENVLVAYIQTLRAARKRDLIPVYASRLQVARYVVAYSRVMQDITESREQEQTLSLLEHYGLDITMILKEQLAFLLDKLIKSSPTPAQPLKMLESTEISPLYPGQRIIEDFLPADFADEDEAIVRSLKWFYIMHGRWNETFQALSLALRKCLSKYIFSKRACISALTSQLVTGRIASALMIVQEFPYDTVSIRKSYQVIGKSVNLMDHDGPAPANEQPTWELLKRQSRTYYELELLVNAIKALADWRIQEREVTRKKTAMASSAPTPLRAAKEAVDEAMALVLNGLLQNSLNDEEAADLDAIRTFYIPEIVLAYNSVLHSAGSLISRDNLIESMDLSTTIAQENSHIAECFVKARRMRELVTSFAETSKAMLILKEAGRPWKPKKDREGKDLGLWEIEPQTHQLGALRNGEPREVSIS